MKTTTIEKKHLIIEADDIKTRFPDHNFEYEQYRDYRDTIDEKTLKDCMPDESKYKKDWWLIDYKQFVDDRKCNIEEKIFEWNWPTIYDSIDEDLRLMVKNKLKELNIVYDSFEFDFYADDFYSIDLDLDYILGRSPIVRNLIRFNNYDWFDENETYKDWQALKEFVSLNKKAFWLKVDIKSLEDACKECIYTWSDLKYNIKTSISNFFDTLWKWEVDVWCYNAVLHLSTNGSWSPEFRPCDWIIKIGKPLKTQFDRRDRNLDDAWYSVQETYWWSINEDY